LCKLLAERCSYPREVLHCPKHTSDGLKTLRSCLEFVGRLIASWTYLVRSQLVEQLVFAIEDARMRSKKLVGRACQKITIQSLYIDRLVRCILDGIDVAERTYAVRQFDDLTYIIDRPHSIRGIANSNEPGAWRNLSLHIL